jgi:hypothetical protein
MQLSLALRQVFGSVEVSRVHMGDFSGEGELSVPARSLVVPLKERIRM